MTVAGLLLITLWAENFVEAAPIQPTKKSWNVLILDRNNTPWKTVRDWDDASENWFENAAWRTFISDGSAGRWLPGITAMMDQSLVQLELFEVTGNEERGDASSSFDVKQLVARPLSDLSKRQVLLGDWDSDVVGKKGAFESGKENFYHSRFDVLSVSDQYISVQNSTAGTYQVYGTYTTWGSYKFRLEPRKYGQMDGKAIPQLLVKELPLQIAKRLYIADVDKSSLETEAAIVPAKGGVVFEVGIANGRSDAPLECKRLSYPRPLSKDLAKAQTLFLKDHAQAASICRRSQIYSVCPDRSGAVVVVQGKLYWVDTKGTKRLLTSVRNVRGLQWIQLDSKQKASLSR